MKEILLSIISIIMLNSTSLFALNLEEAVDKALQDNYNLQVQKYIYIQAKENVNLNKSAFLPKVNLSYEYNDRNKIIGNELKKDSTISSVVSYNLFKGLSDFYTLNSAKFLEKSSNFTLKAFRQDLILDTKEAYINYLNNKKNLLSYEDAFRLFDRQYVDTKIKYEQGILLKNDLLQVHVNLLRSKENVINAKNDLEVSLLELSNIMGGKKLKDSEIEDLKVINFDRNIYNKTQLNSRSELQALGMAISSYKSLADSKKGSFLPKIDASFSVNKYGDNFSVNSNDGNPKYQEMARLNLSWNLYNGGEDKSQKELYLLQRKELQSKFQELKLDINLQYEKTVLKFNVVQQNLKTSKLGLEQAKENYKLVKSRFDEGVSITTDLIDANFLLTQAKQKYYQSYYDNFLVLANFHRIFEIE